LGEPFQRFLTLELEPVVTCPLGKVFQMRTAVQETLGIEIIVHLGAEPLALLQSAQGLICNSQIV
jgi:hypothetical protein